MAMPELAHPGNAVEAVIHPGPYAYYARLRAQRPLFFDAGLNLWVAASHAVVDQALHHPALRVRPVAEPVPRALVGTSLGEVFAQLVRMNDGSFHARHKPAVQRAAERLTNARVNEAAAAAALDLAPRADANAFLTMLPLQAMARVLGVAAPLLDRTTRWVDEFVQGLSAQSSPETLERACEAARALMAQGGAEGLDVPESANLIALMQQSLDATAGLMGNTVCLLQHSRELGACGVSFERWRSVVAEVARWDSPVQNTRRFAAADLLLAGQSIAQGQGVLLVLASANRDEALNPEPDVFDPSRRERRSMSFGAGAHGCPGERIAIEIAAEGLRTIAESGLLSRLFGRHAGFRPLPNARVPVFET
jgi:cytochrome P450